MSGFRIYYHMTSDSDSPPTLQVQVGVGTLAGSTVMLLTIPWFLAVLGGRVELDAQGKPMYGKLRGLASLEHKSEGEMD
jgi:hypothetical protein